jgi:hypothetical protein
MIFASEIQTLAAMPNHELLLVGEPLEVSSQRFRETVLDAAPVVLAITMSRPK